MPAFDIQSVFSVRDQMSGPVATMSRAIGGLSSQVQSVQTGLSRMAVTAGGVLGAVGLALGFRQAKEGLIGLNAQMESTTIGLATILSGATGTKFTDALKIAAQEFRIIQKLSIQTAATGSELFQIYKGASGAILGMGKGLHDIQQVSLLTSIAASAFQIDFAQASRDINFILTGRAGVEQRLFQELKATGFLKYSAEEFNKIIAQSPQQGFAILMAALEKTRPAAEAYGKSWEGLTSTFKEFMQNFSRIMGGGIFGALKKQLTDLNDFLLQNEERISKALGDFGNRIGKFFTIEGAQTIGTILAGAVAAKFAVGLAGGLIGGIPGIIKIVSGGFPAILSAIGPFLMALPALIIGLPIAAAVIGGTLLALSKNFNGIRDRLQDALKGIWFSGEGFIKIIQDLWPRISQIASIIGHFTTTILIDVLADFAATISKIGDFLKSIDWEKWVNFFAHIQAKREGEKAASAFTTDPQFFVYNRDPRINRRNMEMLQNERQQAYESTYQSIFRALTRSPETISREFVNELQKGISEGKIKPPITMNQYIDKVQLEYNFDQAEPRIFRRFEKDLKNVARRGVQSIFALDVGP